MKKSISHPSLTTGEAIKRSSLRRNAVSWNHLSDAALPQEQEKTELVEKIDAILPSSISQKLFCYESYGFPSEILQSTAPSTEKAEKLLDITSCLVTPEEPPTETKIDVRSIPAVEERFQRMVYHVRKRRKSLSLSL